MFTNYENGYVIALNGTECSYMLYTMTKNKQYLQIENTTSNQIENTTSID